MARIVVKCRYSENYILTGIRTENALVPVGGRITCPYCLVEHVWIATGMEKGQTDSKPTKPIVRLAS